MPEQLVDVQSFLGFVNFYRRFIADFAHIAHPLHALSRKNTSWAWTQEHQEAFQSLKDRVTSATILVQPRTDRPFRLETDSSDYATGAVLSQQDDDEKWHPVGFYSKGLNDVERNYPIHDKEMLGHTGFPRMATSARRRKAQV